MAAINFPSNPSLNDIFTVGSDTWRYNGVSWEIAPVESPTFTNITADAITATNIEGNLVGTVTGSVTGNVTGDVTGNVTGNATTATRLATARTINGVSFNGTSNITVTAAAGTLTGNTINSSVTSSSLSSVGTLNNLTVSGNITANSNVIVSAGPTEKEHATNKNYVDNRSIAMGIALS